MRLLLDTHALLWWLLGDEQLSKTAREAVDDEENDVFVSAVSAMEIATKHRIGKLDQAAAVAGHVAEIARRQGFEELPLSLAHGDLAGTLAFDHRDPFDRLLIAQAMESGMWLVSNEVLFDATGVRRLW